MEKYGIIVLGSKKNHNKILSEGKGMDNSDYKQERPKLVGNYIIETGATIRQAGKKFNISKTTAHNDVTVKLPNTSPAKASEVRAVLDVHLKERAMRGGEAMRQKYLNMRL